MGQKNIDHKKIGDVENFLKQGEYFKALKNLLDLENKYSHFIIHWYLGHTYFKLHNYHKAIEHVKKSIDIKSKDSLNLNFLGEIYMEINDYEKSTKLFKEVLDLDQNNKRAILNIAKINLYQGKIKESEKTYQILLKNEPLNIAYQYQLMRIDQKHISNREIKKIEDNYSKFSLENKIYSKLILAKEDEKKQKYTSELNNLIDAHKIFSETKQKATKQQFEFYKKNLPKFIEKVRNIDFNIQSDFNPIFIMGLPRSGTTLVEKIINSANNNVQSLGESDVFDKVFYSNQIIEKNKNEYSMPDFKFLQKMLVQQYYSQGLKKGNLVFTDKSLSNFLYFELIFNIFPKAKFIYCYRNPTANIIGILRSFLPNLLWSHSLDKIFLICDMYYKKLHEIKKKNLTNFYIISLEELSKKPEIISKDLFKFLNFKWSKNCIDDQINKVSFKTASNLEVRKKIRRHDLKYTSNFLKILRDSGYNYDWLI